MKIAILGYGKMGRMIETIARERGHDIVAVKKDAKDDFHFNGAEVAIDFSVPDAAIENITSCFEQGVPVVSGTTGWLDNYGQVIEKCQEQNGAFIYASNFSLGVNIFFELNRHLSRLMKDQKSYTAAIEEIHHVHKLDAPSGTAITLAEDMIDNLGLKDWSLQPGSDDQLPVTSLREGEVPGTHTVTYTSEVDKISIRHEALNRKGFALGAVVAAEWLHDKKGVFTMKDVLNLG
ncbi:4-hydroxy-tetrahydrodipicolinate reductase [Robertkochia aurantiaca]|uniref:4-hydroxy-tetrahydrodipicolinate reductase n=1 Tax=Robertkochia aurantiaca TaxID=2873700 RepID=UPI001CCBE4BD|nr:4-hydroxy-tetrahydrodipicolinate reductase [Robertkochia sp. 3YJGBD-33]